VTAQPSVTGEFIFVAKMATKAPVHRRGPALYAKCYVYLRTTYFGGVGLGALRGADVDLLEPIPEPVVVLFSL
jgi:hypothetical protein